MTVSSDELRTVTVGGVEISYAEAGEGEPLVLVHGNFASHIWFSEQLSSPPEGCRVIALDLPNFGASDPMPQPVEIASYGGYLAEFCQALGLERFALLGHSLGGAVAQALAVAHPERVSHLLLIASAAPEGHVTPEEHYPFLETLRGNREMLGQALAATMPTAKPDYFERIVDDALAMAPQAFTENGRALARFDVSRRTSAVQSPVLVVRGNLDLPHLITEEIARSTAAAYRNSRLELWEGVGHSPQIEAPGRFNETLSRFLEEHPMR